ncbi:MAG TPA: DUF5686 family protein [Bacteroidales bacterium]|nr:DUF5686 family protein [Bacteroidales bacterium]HPS16078.1 DUF5686 family protein [Bacteroidales bacterium]
MTPPQWSTIINDGEKNNKRINKTIIIIVLQSFINRIFRLLVLLSFFLFFQSDIFSQSYSVVGKVIDAQNHEPLAFVNILINNENNVHQTDIDGVFKITSLQNIDSLKLSYVGYESYTYKVGDKTKNILIALTSKEVLLNEVVILPGENPAHRIINRMIENRDLNNPEKLSSFSYSSYNKMIFTADLDSVKTDTAVGDSDLIKTKVFFEKQYLFLMESVMERKFMYPDKNSEKLIAYKISGFKDPLFALLVTQMQSFSFYNEIITIGDKNYITPVSKGSTDKYFFLLEDTLYQGNDSIYVISFKPHRNRNFDGLKGLIYINTNGCAIQNVIAEPANEEAGGMSIKIQQMYELIDNKQWFPVQLNSDFIFKNISVNRVKLIGQGRSYLKNIAINPELKKSDFSNIELEIQNADTKNDDKIWNVYRTDSLSDKDKRTYQVIDSLGKEVNFDKKMKSIETLMSGKIPVKFIDLDIERFIRFNDYEGFRLGLGMHNNYKLSERFLFGGYFAYGFNDNAFKYGGDASIILSKKHDLSAGVSYIKDVSESGGVDFNEQNLLFSDARFRDYLINRMDSIEKKEVFIKFSALRYLKADVSLSQIHKIVTNDYYYGVTNENVSLLLDEYNFTELAFGLCYSYKEKFIKTLRYKMSMGTKYPVVYFNFIHGFNNLWDGAYSYSRFDLKIKKTFFIKNLGHSSFHFQAGYINGDIPYCNLYSGNGSYRQFTIAAPGSFATMRMNEFLSDQYAALFYTHSFDKLLFRFKKFAPIIAIATNLGIGELKNSSKHYNVTFSQMNKIYYESGLLVNNLINTGFYGLGVGAYYRYGNYALSSFKENIAYKFTFTIAM